MSEFFVNGIRIKIEAGENGLFYGTSPDEKGLLIAKPSAEKVIKEVPKALAELRSLKADSTDNC